MYRFLIFAAIALLLFHTDFAQADDKAAEGSNKTEITKSTELGMSLLGSQLPQNFRAKEGDWLLYRLENKVTRIEDHLGFGVCGKGPGDSLWMELSTGEEKGTPVVLRFLLTFEKGRPAGISRLVMKAGDYSAFRVESDEAGQLKGVSQSQGHYSELGRDHINVEAGKFEVERGRYRSHDGQIQELWLSSEVPLFGLVRAMSIHYDMELIEISKDYSPKIEEDPKYIDDSGKVK